MAKTTGKSSTGGNVGIVWAVSPSDLGENVAKYGDFVITSCMHELEKVARDIEDWMKQNHKWRNITGEAEAGLKCEVFHNDNGIQIVAYHDESGHTRPHGYWLEVIQDGRWGIIPLGLEVHYGDIMAAANKAIGK